MGKAVLEILTEEPSMEYFLQGLLPRVLPDGYQLGVNCFIRPHEGKSHLQKAIGQKMRAYPYFGYPVKVMVVHDQDSNDCRQLKQTLVRLLSNDSSIPSLVRIACRELENWYLGDLPSLETVYPDSNASQYIAKAKFRDPDYVHGSYEILHMTDKFSKTHAARAMGPLIRLHDNRSKSFINFITGLQKLLADGK